MDKLVKTGYLAGMLQEDVVPQPKINTRKGRFDKSFLDCYCDEERRKKIPFFFLENEINRITTAAVSTKLDFFN